MKRAMVLSVLVGLMFAGTASFGDPPADKWRTIEVFAVKFDIDGFDPRLTILKDEPFHDTGIIWARPGGSNNNKLRWNLNCAGCSEDDTTFVVYDVKFVGDLHDLTEDASNKASTNVDEPLPPGLEVRRGSPKNPGLNKPFEVADVHKPAQKKKMGQKIVTRPILDLQNRSELWKYSVLVEIVQDESDSCILEDENGEISVSEDCCEGQPLCDYWDPHIYMHGDQDF